MDLQDKMAAALAQLESKLEAADRVMIGEARWEPHPTIPDRLVLACDSVPVTTVKLLGQDRVLELYHRAKAETEQWHRDHPEGI